MATETGTATDYRDLLQKLKLFLTGENVSPPSGLNWEVLEERSQFTSPQTDIPAGDADELMESAANNDQTHDQIIFKSTGGTSPETPCYFGIQTLGLAANGRANWQIRGLTGFSQNSPITDYVRLVDQPGRSPPVFLLLQDAPMTYWFIGNERHIKGVVKTGTAYHPFYIGFLNTFATSAEYPYPMYVAGTGFQETTLFSSNTVSVSGLLNPGGDSTSSIPIQGDPYPAEEATGMVRFTDGNWYMVKNFFNQSSNEAGVSQEEGVVNVWPQIQDSGANAGEDVGIEDNWSIRPDAASLTVGGTPLIQILRSLGSPETTMLWPLTLYNSRLGQLLGEIDGCYWAPNAGGITSEDTLTDTGESPEIVNIVFQNVFRTDIWSFFAMRNE